MITTLDTPERDPYDEYRTKYKALMTQAVNAMTNSMRFSNRKG